ncbi:uncharacterized protein LDX57_007758 [Aspergillus melleus]|uniref:uncharacterized protein n=1 Tax=Aspergillus melleus TaxID=138277 RepID=UPI001E8D8478|nr:uncharacterized protein LDX57_007758 [Aspergillus melleus]KAH8430088.1 hypothetical protein LDX57_007758 [Aspergillus melleus]
MPWTYNAIASIAHWTLLAGYLIAPGTFTALQKSGQVQNALAKDQVGQAVLNTIQNPPLLAIACILFVVSTAALGWLYWEWCNNYIWLAHRLFTPIIMNAAAGLATTLINIYTARDGDWSIMALITTIITGVTLVTSFSLAMVFKFIKLKEVQEAHVREVYHSGPERNA